MHAGAWLQDLQSELDSVEFEDDQRSKLDDDLAEGLASMDLEYDEDLSFQQELETELGRPYKSAREAALDMMQVSLAVQLPQVETAHPSSRHLHARQPGPGEH